MFGSDGEWHGKIKDAVGGAGIGSGANGVGGGTDEPDVQITGHVPQITHTTQAAA